MSVVDSPPDLDAALRDRFGLEKFRPGQREVIENVIAGRDVLCVMPTGGGKSLCYQLPGVVLSGVTLVISPLIALMKDQVDALLARGLRATLINSTLDPSEQMARISEIEMGRFDLVYVAPERFRSSRFVEAMNRVKPALLAVDEAHCISEWGHDFRPDYAKIGLARRALGMPPCIALTATATDLVRRDISEKLDLRDPAQFITGFDRPNLTYHAREVRKDSEKLAALAEVLDRNPGPSIIYASSRKRCEEVCAYLTRDLRRDAVIYHAGMTREDRTTAQDRFMGGDAEVVVATNAFGMGVDKRDIRSVVHFNMPGTLEAYYQEAGRAGRDGLPAECVLFHGPGDRRLQEMFIENEYPPSPDVHRIYDYLRTVDADPIELTQSEIKELTGVSINDSAVGTALRILETAGGVEQFRPRENMAIVRINAEPDDPPIADRVGGKAPVQKIVAIALDGLVNKRFGEQVYFHPDNLAASLGLERTALTRAIKHLAAEFPVDYVPPFRGNAVRVLDKKRGPRDLKIDFMALQKRRKAEYDKLDRMVRYATTAECRRAFILGYFGDLDATTCGRCDNCGTSGKAVSRTQTISRPIDTAAGREVLQKILSGVARAKWGFGKTAIAQMLVGSNSERMQKSGLTRLSTFGVLANSGFTQAELVLVIDSLASAGLLHYEEVDRFRPVVKLTDEGWSWVRSPEPPPVPLLLESDLLEKVRCGGLERVHPAAKPPAAKFRPSTLDEAIDASSPHVSMQSAGWDGDESGASWEPTSPVMGDPLWEALKAQRLLWAKESNLKAFQVFTNKMLDEMARQRPRSAQALAAMKGIGPSTMERYGDAILKIINAHANEVAEKPLPETFISEPPRPSPPPIRADVRPIATVPPASSTPEHVPTQEWTRRLIERGFTIEESAAIRGLDVATITLQATGLVRKGIQIPTSAYLTDERARRWRAWIEHEGIDGPLPDDPMTERYWELFAETFARE